MKIVINSILKLEITFPEEMSADEFLGIIEDTAKYIRKNQIGGNSLSLPRDWTKDDDKLLIELVNNNFPRNEIAGQINREIGAVYTRITKLRKEGKIKMEIKK